MWPPSFAQAEKILKVFSSHNNLSMCPFLQSQNVLAHREEFGDEFDVSSVSAAGSERRVYCVLPHASLGKVTRSLLLNYLIAMLQYFAP